MTYDEHQLSEVAQMVLDVGRRRRPTDNTHATLITFSGNLGAGKTTLIQEIAKQLGVSETLQSPTFVIYKRYELPTITPPSLEAIATPPLGRGGNPHEVWRSLIHGDMYRLESGSDIQKLGWQELLDNPENIICIEWPEKITDVIPDWAIRVSLQHQGEKRIIDIL